MAKITLNNLVDLQNETTAVTTINNNNAAIVAAINNTVSRDGTSPNTLSATIDANSQRILNLPSPITVKEPLRLQDLNSFIGGGTITAVPAGGNTGDALVKNSNTDYDVKWGADSAALAAGTNIAITGTSPATISTTTTPTFTRVNGVTLTTGSGTLTLGSNTLTVTASTSITPTASGVGVWSGGNITGSTSPALGTATATSINGATVSPGHHSGEPSNGNAAAGEIGEYVFSNIQNASGVALTTGTTSNVTSISLTAGDWDVWIQPMFQGGATTNTTFLDAAVNTVSATLPVIDGLNTTQWTSGGGTVLGAGVMSIPTLRTRYSLSSTTTIFFVAQATFTVSTMKAFGAIQARRAR